MFYGLLSQGSAFNTLGAGTDTLSNFENLTGGAFDDTLGGGLTDSILDGGQGNDLLFGWVGNDTLLGGAGNDTLNGGTGNDSMAGGLGDDTYVVDNVSDVIVENPGEGNDTVFVTGNGWSAGANIETIYLAGAATQVNGYIGGGTVLVANATLDSRMGGGSGNDTFWGQAGADSLVGGAGDDIIRGGAGNDTLQGAAGNDQLVGGDGADLFEYIAAGWGYDQIFDFVVSTDKISIGDDVAANYAALTVYGAGGSTVVQLGTARIDVYNAVLTQSDFIFFVNI